MWHRHRVDQAGADPAWPPRGSHAQPGGPGRATAAAVWLTVAIGLGALTWYAVGAVIDPSADGAGVLTETEVAQSLASASAPAQAPAAPTGAPGAGPSGATGRPAPSATPTSGPSGGGESGGGESPVHPPGTPTPAATRTAPAVGPAGSGSSTGPTAVARRWRVTGGEVGALCRGQEMSLLFATPADGWTVHVETVRADRFALEFHRDEEETDVQARCVDGAPVATANRTSNDEDDGADGPDAADGDEAPLPHRD